MSEVNKRARDCPCKHCEKAGCGKYHDVCKEYNNWKNAGDKIRLARQKERESYAISPTKKKWLNHELKRKTK